MTAPLPISNSELRHWMRDVQNDIAEIKMHMATAEMFASLAQVPVRDHHAINVLNGPIGAGATVQEKLDILLTNVEKVLQWAPKICQK